jgi:hypothetical protein
MGNDGGYAVEQHDDREDLGENPKTSEKMHPQVLQREGWCRNGENPGWPRQLSAQFLQPASVNVRFRINTALFRTNPAATGVWADGSIGMKLRQPARGTFDRNQIFSGLIELEYASRALQAQAFKFAFSRFEALR